MMLNIHILGAGAVGQLIYQQLVTHPNLSLSLLGRQTPAKQMQFTDLSGKELHSSFAYQQLPLQQAINCDLLIVTVKAYQVLEALTPLLPFLPKHCPILLLHNGMGTHLAVQQTLDTHPLLLGTTSQGAMRLSPWHIKHTGHGLTQLGQYAGAAIRPELKQALLSALPNSQWRDSIIKALWEKLAVNAVINPLTTLNHCNNGVLAQSAYKPLKQQILQELQAVAQADGIILETEALWQRVEQVIALTAQNSSSMRQDIQYQRRTEVEFINGFIWARGKVHGIATPINQQLTEQVLAMTTN